MAEKLAHFVKLGTIGFYAFCADPTSPDWPKNDITARTIANVHVRTPFILVFFMIRVQLSFEWVRKLGPVNSTSSELAAAQIPLTRRAPARLSATATADRVLPVV